MCLLGRGFFSCHKQANSFLSRRILPLPGTVCVCANFPPTNRLAVALCGVLSGQSERQQAGSSSFVALLPSQESETSDRTPAPKFLCCIAFFPLAVLFPLSLFFRLNFVCGLDGTVAVCYSLKVLIFHHERTIDPRAVYFAHPGVQSFAV